MEAAACAVGRIDPDGPWVGFAPSMDDGYALVVGLVAGGSRHDVAAADDLWVLAILYFEESLDAPPDALAATHGDIGALVRHVAEHEPDAGRRRLMNEAVDAVDDGLAADVTIARLNRALGGEADAGVRLRRRVMTLIATG